MKKEDWKEFIKSNEILMKEVRDGGDLVIKLTGVLYELEKKDIKYQGSYYWFKTGTMYEIQNELFNEWCEVS